MKMELVEKIANTVLYEGYNLYPYRPSAVKNQRRFNFGVLAPQSYSEAQRGNESWCMQTECLLLGDQLTTLDVSVRFLHLGSREVGERIADCENKGKPLSISDADFKAVESLEVDGRIFQAWQEAVEREVKVPTLTIGALTPAPRREVFSFPPKQEIEPLRNPSGDLAGVIVRNQQAIEGVIELRIADCELQIVRNERMGTSSSNEKNPKSEIRNPQLFRVTARVFNPTRFEKAAQRSRDEALMYSLVSTHTILSVRDGEFVSAIDPPEEFRESAALCQNIGTWPVLVGESQERDLVLSSPIILYDYPQIAPESADDLFDGTEIDEILMLRILTMTEEEKREMREVDERTRQILERAETLSSEELMKLHGALRSLRTVTTDQDERMGMASAGR